MVHRPVCNNMDMHKLLKQVPLALLLLVINCWSTLRLLSGCSGCYSVLQSTDSCFHMRTLIYCKTQYIGHWG